MPVSRSTSTTAMCAPNGKLGCPCAKSSASSSGPRWPSGSPSPFSDACATCAQLTEDPATPRTPKPVSVRSMSSVEASSRCAAISRACATSDSLALWIAVPPACSDREPDVPAPRATRAVSDCTTLIMLIGTWSTADASCA